MEKTKSVCLCNRCGNHYEKLLTLTRRTKPETMSNEMWEKVKNICSNCGIDEALFDLIISQKIDLNSYQKEIRTEREWLDKLVNKVGDLLEMLKEKEEEWNDYFEVQSKISHIDHCQGGYKIHEKRKVISIWCDNDTKFNKDGIHTYSGFQNIEGWEIDYYFEHALNNLQCLGYCKIYVKWRDEI